ncbi:hypothetical protein [Nonomuraea endophytica]|uniref:Uncharacterized protein n=1 Tax=Nonomuraea endophytica TaxID=714136 RepID=A0A7W8EGJ7_9ACTN|nr:hypothetical protein [Nonomuraea endophytica]MBB5078684.1 hypothetical protein [Nonomuraea endophytica]
MTVQDLREVLREHGAAAPPPNPARRTQVEARIRRRRLRSRAVAGGAIAAAVALAATLLPGTAQPPDQTAATKPALPDTFVAADGTEYRKVAATTVVTPGKKKVIVTVPLTGNPIDLAASCTGAVRGSITPSVAAAGLPPQHGLVACSKEMQVLGLQVPKGAGKAEVVIDPMVAGTGCIQTKKNGPCDQPKIERSVWSLAFYEWIPPARPVIPEEPRALPGRMGEMKLRKSESGTWPEQDTVTFRTTGAIGLEKICTGDLASRLRFSVSVNGTDTGVNGSCAVWKRGDFPWAMGMHALPEGKTSTVTLKLRMDGGSHPNRPVRWSVGVYGK